MRITVVGTGRWGTFLAEYCRSIGHEVYTYDRESIEDINKLIRQSDFYIIAIPCQNIMDFLDKLNKESKEIPVVIAMKGLQMTTGFSMFDICTHNGINEKYILHLCGPAHPQELNNGKNALLSLSSKNYDLLKLISDQLTSNKIRFELDTNIEENMLGSALKNVAGLGAGILDGCGRSDLKGTYMVKILKEVDSFIYNFTGKKGIAYNLCHLGDYEATLFSKYSHNRQFGESWCRRESFEELAEGYYTIQSFDLDRDIYPLFNDLYAIFYKGDIDRYINQFLSDIIKEY